MQTGGPIWFNATGTLTPWPKRASHNAIPVLLSFSPWGNAHLCKLKNSQNSGELRPPRGIFLFIKTNYHLLTYVKLYCHLSTLCLSAWSFVIFLLWMLCVSVTKNLRSITVGINIWHKPEFWCQWTHSTFRKILKQKTLTNSKSFHVLEVLSFKEHEKGKAIQT